MIAIILFNHILCTIANVHCSYVEQHTSWQSLMHLLLQSDRERRNLGSFFVPDVSDGSLFFWFAGVFPEIHLVFSSARHCVGRDKMLRGRKRARRRLEDGLESGWALRLVPRKF